MKKPTIRLEDYRPPAWRMQAVDIDFLLDVQESLVSARVLVIQDPAQKDVELRLDGENLELLEIRIDGRALASDEYRIDGSILILDGVRDTAVIETRSRIANAASCSVNARPKVSVTSPGRSTGPMCWRATR